MKLIVRYLARESLAASLFVFVALMTLFAFFDLINELDALGKGHYGFIQILIYVTLNVPGHLYELLPVAALIGTLLAMARLVENSEFSIMLVSGLSMRRIAMYLMMVGLVFTALTFVFGEVIAPASERYAEQMKLKATNALVAQAFRSGLWVRDDRNFINVREVTPEGELRDLNVYAFDDSFHLQRIYRAATGVFLHDNVWQLNDVNETKFTPAGDVSVAHLPNSTWASVLTPNIMNVLLVPPEKMAMLDLWAYIQHLHANNQPSKRYEIALWSKLIYPFAAPIMILLALPFAYHRPRAGGAGIRVFAGIMLGLGYHLFNRLFAYMGLLNDWSPLFSALTPTLLFLGAGIYLLNRVERQ
ncbi:MAG: LPS export ABC transporter permease LptG [Sulfuriferula sp.]|nr:LPS export ABC transporter permease LptG [Sulfuriferula sp.]